MGGAEAESRLEGGVLGGGLVPLGFGIEGAVDGELAAALKRQEDLHVVSAKQCNSVC